ncbi:hypothetical protein [Gardnerella vaginalis]|uniref:hypothetical protein n=1 Tax=Gardnerella vaginalis TaxID=2702 RepID=UPI00026356D9|nr:hypothetical protein [Gardnerella vaginalis]EIK76045.1 hypothetical protein CGSMWGv0288E_06860 [Gardnerella vaginalis 0288E]AYZ21454.1 hypothetical protein EGX90_02565 [Gardnerella vaginalis]EIK75478.1 hypothetical protein CGSMWGv75712_06345 [Gardnerella vaginalis 75712]PNL25583.1 hypothetical protein CEP75_002550 [Gardnerella vaginalis]PTE03283.1 hypothetical protein C6Y65_06820 [Gardnerella vaginalis]
MRQELASPPTTPSKGNRSRGLSARTSSLALKAHCAFNLKQAQRSELPFRATL